MASSNCEVIDIEERLPPGVTSVIGQGTSSFVGLIDQETVLKYPLFPVERFRIEIEHKLLEQLGQHPRIIESGGLTENGLLLRYAKNGTLYDYILEHSNLSTIQRIQLCTQIAEGLIHLHSRFVYHGDLRPGNILLDENLDVKLADIQGALKSDDGRVILDGLARESSMYYMPRDRDHLDIKTDLFAFGSTVHFVMTGQEVFPDLSPSTYHDEEEIEKEISRRFAEQEYPSVSYPPVSIVRQCWQGGYASTEELLMDLKVLETKIKPHTT